MATEQMTSDVRTRFSVFATEQEACDAVARMFGTADHVTANGVWQWFEGGPDPVLELRANCLRDRWIVFRLWDGGRSFSAIDFT